MFVEEFAYDLPDGAIAQVPAEPRDSAKLLVSLDPQTPIVHTTVADICRFVRPGDVVVLNDTKVLPARLAMVRPTGGAAELLLLHPLAEPDGMGQRWEVLARPGRKLKPGMTVTLSDGNDAIRAVMGEDLGEGRREVELRLDPRLRLDGTADPESDPDWSSTFARMLIEQLNRYGSMPLPPYLHPVDIDPQRYQTTFAKRQASAAAPTAGLHITQQVLDSVIEAGATVEFVELVVGLATFKPMATTLVEDHPMHSESYAIAPDVWQRIAQADRVIAVGTTTTRALESAAMSGHLSGSTELFIRRPFDWKVVDVMLTNFHLPTSSLLVLIDAFVGERWKALYSDALAGGYRFLSFGDAMLIARA